MPIIRSVSQTGVVLVEFTYKMIPANIGNVTNGTIWIDGVERPALRVQVLSSDLEVTPQEKLTFTWECLNFTEYTMTLQLYFDNPNQVSITVPLETVLLTFWD